MKPQSEREPAFSAGKIAWSLVLLAAAFLTAAFPRFAHAVAPLPSLADMARLEADDRSDPAGTTALLHGYVAFGFGAEAASLLERRIRLGILSRDSAAPLFEKLVGDGSRWEDPVHLVGACDTAARSGVESPTLLYSCGTALRMAGQTKDAARILARIGRDSTYHSHALFALGQISVETGDFEAALDSFKRAEIEGSASRSPVSARARRAQAQLLLLTGRAAEASRLVAGSPGKEPDLARSVETALAGADPSSALEGVPTQRIAAEPPRSKVLFLLLKAGVARDRGRFGSAVADVSRADDEIRAAFSRDSSPSPSRTPLRGAGKTVESLLQAQEAARQRLASRPPGEDGAAVRGPAVELLMGLLLLERYAGGSLPEGSPARSAGDRFSRQSGVVEPLLNWIERFYIEGVEHAKAVVKWHTMLRDVDRFVNEFREQTRAPREPDRSARRDRLLLRLERSQAEVRRLRERIQRRWDSEAAPARSGAIPVSLLLRDLGLYLNELDEIRSTMDEARKFAGTTLRAARHRSDPEGGSREAMEVVVRDTLALSGEWLTALLPSLRDRQEKARIAFLERERQSLSTLVPVVRRHLADALVAQAWSLRRSPKEDAQREYWTAVKKAASLLGDGDLAPTDRLATAINIGWLLAGGRERWETYPGRHAGEREKALISDVLPILEAAAAKDFRREEARYLIAALAIQARGKENRSAARAFLEEFPASPFAGDIAVRAGHEELLAREMRRAETYYRAASAAGSPAARAVARHMLGWMRLRNGDAAGALRELAPILSDSSFRCAEPDALEQDLLTLSVEALRDSPPEDFASFPPVAQGTCGGRLALVMLAEAESGRGDGSRAAAAYDALALRFPKEEDASSYGIRAIRELVRAERNREAMSRALALRETSGGGEKTATDLSRLLHTLSGRLFAEGVRSGDRSAFALAAQGIERYFAVVGTKRTGADDELLLKRATALLWTGERNAGVRILKELSAGRRHGDIGERAALLYAETMIAGYERKEESAKDAEEAARLLLRDYPSENAAGLAFRAASGFLDAEAYDPAARVAEAVEKCGAAGRSLKARARLVQAQVALFRNDPAAARGKAATVLEEPAADAASRELATRAKEISLLAALKEIEGKTASRDWKGAGKLFELAGDRFVDRSETPLYYLSALRSYRQGGHEDQALAIGLLFMREFPRREEAIEVVEAIGPYLQARNELARTADLYATVAQAFPRNPMAPGFLFHAARISEFAGYRDAALKRFSAYRSRYPERRWMSAYAGIAIGAIKLQEGDTKSAIREMEAALRQVDAGLEPDAPKDLFTRAGYARIAIGENWAKQFRAARLVHPLEKSLAVKEQLFLRALSAFELAEVETPLEMAVHASRLSADLFVEFGKSILDSQRPKGMRPADRANYEEALKSRARDMFERAIALYAAACDRLELENASADLAVAIRNRRDEVLALVSAVSAQGKERAP